MTHSLFLEEEERKNVVIEMPYHPIVSVNHCYGRNSAGRMYLKRDARLWKYLAAALFREALNENNITQFGPHIRVHLNARFPLKKGQKPDSTNFMKLFIDGIAEELGIDDHTIVHGDSIATHLRENGEGVLIYTVVEINEEMA